MYSFHMDSIFIPYHSMVYFLILAEVMQYSIWNPWIDGGIHPFHMEYTGERKVLKEWDEDGYPKKSTSPYHTEGTSMFFLVH